MTIRSITFGEETGWVLSASLLLMGAAIAEEQIYGYAGGAVGANVIDLVTRNALLTREKSTYGQPVGADAIAHVAGRAVHDARTSCDSAADNMADRHGGAGEPRGVAPVERNDSAQIVTGMQQ